MNILLAGFGNVGRSLAQMLAEDDRDLRIVGVVTATRGTLFHASGLDCRSLANIPPRAPLRAYPRREGLCYDVAIDELLREDSVDVLVDATPTILPDAGPALAWCQLALQRGVDLVLANKAPLVADFPGLRELAQASGARLRYEATVMAGTPVFNLARYGLAAGRFRSARGILNGTCNYMLTRMEVGLSYPEALAEAQQRGYAEADPSADVDGWDTAVKLVALSGALLGRELALDQVDVRGIRNLTTAEIQAAREKQRRWKFIGAIDDQGARVAPITLPVTDPLANVPDAQNALILQCEPLGEVSIQGPGAGGRETAFGIVNDLLELRRVG